MTTKHTDLCLELPLRCRVAIALNWTDVRNIGPRIHGGPGHREGDDVWVGKPAIPYTGIVVHGGCQVGLTGDYSYIPRFDTDWAAGGPLIERLQLSPCPPLDEWSGWAAVAFHDDGTDTDAPGETALIALCHLVLALHEKGRLAPVSS